MIYALHTVCDFVDDTYFMTYHEGDEMHQYFGVFERKMLSEIRGETAPSSLFASPTKMQEDCADAEFYMHGIQLPFPVNLDPPPSITRGTIPGVVMATYPRFSSTWLWVAPVQESATAKLPKKVDFHIMVQPESWEDRARRLWDG